LNLIIPKEHMVDLVTNLDFWDNGEIVSLDKPIIHADEHSTNYATKGFEGGCTHKRPNNVVIFRPEPRFVRFREDTARELFLDVKWSPEQLLEITKDLIRRNEAKIKSGEIIRYPFRGEVVEYKESPDRWYIRPHVRHAARSLGVYTPPEPKVFIYIAPFGKYHGDALKNGAKLKIVEETRIDPRAFSSAAKGSLFYAVGFKAIAKAKKEDPSIDEVILPDMWGYVADGSGGNVSMIKGGVLYVTRLHSSLNGIVKQSIVELAQNELGMKIKETDISPKQIYQADEVFLTGNAAQITPVREIDAHLIGDGLPGPYTRKLQDMFSGIVLNNPNLFPNCSKYQDWMEPVYPES
jgi:branched-chain amino acid aminotransferase